MKTMDTGTFSFSELSTCFKGEFCKKPANSNDSALEKNEEIPSGLLTFY